MRTFYFAPDADPGTEFDDGEHLTGLFITMGPEEAAAMIQKLATALATLATSGEAVVQVELGPGRGDWRMPAAEGEDDLTVEEAVLLRQGHAA